MGCQFNQNQIKGIDAFGSVADMSLGTLGSSLFSTRRGSTGSNLSPKNIIGSANNNSNNHSPPFVGNNSKKPASYSPDDSGFSSFANHSIMSNVDNTRVSVARSSMFSTLSMSDTFGVSNFDLDDDEYEADKPITTNQNQQHKYHNSVVADDDHEDFDDVLNEVRTDLDTFAKNN